MSFTGAMKALYDRLTSFYNGSKYSASSNPGGFANGGNQQGVFIAAMRDFADFGKGVADIGAEVRENADRFDAAVAAIEAGPVTSVNGLSGAVVLPALAAVLPPVNSAPVAGSTAALVGGALTLSVNGFLPLYPKKQKSIRFQVAASATGFGSPVYDSGAVAGVGLSAAVTDAQTRFTGGTTYYLRAQQTDEDNFTSAWSSVTSFVFPRVPSAAAMSAPANGATGVGANNAAITLTAAAYSHPNGIAQASRRFEVSKDDFATKISITVDAGQSGASITNPKDALTANTAYKVRCVDTDANGGVATGAPSTFTTATAFRPNIGDAYQGGFYAGQIKDGAIYDLIVAPKSGGETSGAWGNVYAQQNQVGASSRSSGPENMALANTASGGAGAANASYFCDQLTLNGYSDWYLPAVDELEVAYRNLKPTTTSNATSSGANANSIPSGAAYTASNPSQTSATAFRTGGAEAFAATSYWSSTEASSSNGLQIDFSTGGAGGSPKSSALSCRAFRRVAA